MFKIDQKHYGFHLTFGGFIQKGEMDQWFTDFAAAVDRQKGAFNVFVDMRTLKPLPPEAQDSMLKGQRYARENGMVRSVVIVDNAITTNQFKRIAKETGIYDYERYINSQAMPHWYQTGLAWLMKSVDPDMA